MKPNNIFCEVKSCIYHRNKSDCIAEEYIVITNWENTPMSNMAMCSTYEDTPKKVIK